MSFAKIVMARETDKISSPAACLPVCLSYLFGGPSNFYKLLLPLVSMTDNVFYDRLPALIKRTKTWQSQSSYENLEKVFRRLNDLHPSLLTSTNRYLDPTHFCNIGFPSTNLSTRIRSTASISHHPAAV